MRREVRSRPHVADDWRIADRDDTTQKVGGLGDAIVGAGDGVDESRSTGTGNRLLAGDHGKLRLVSADTMLAGSPGTKASGPSRFASRGHVEKVEFEDTVTLGASANMLFVGCTFRKLITVESGGTAAFIACKFMGSAAVDNSASAVAANIGVVGCIRTSGVAHQFVTTIFEV